MCLSVSNLCKLPQQIQKDANLQISAEVVHTGAITQILKNLLYDSNEVQGHLLSSVPCFRIRRSCGHARSFVDSAYRKNAKCIIIPWIVRQFGEMRCSQWPHSQGTICEFRAGKTRGHDHKEIVLLQTVQNQSPL